MVRETRDRTLDTLLDLDGQVFVIDQKGGHWVKFEVKEVRVTKERPHGIDYSLTLHAKNGERLLGFDNAHSIKERNKKFATYDHKHKSNKVRYYQYKDAASLLEDFWLEVEVILEERGVKL